MVLNPAEPGGRRYDPLGQAEAKISELQQLLQKERDATEEQRRYHNKYRKRVRVLEHDLAELRKVLGDRASVVSGLSSRPSAHSNEVKVVEAYFERYENGLGPVVSDVRVVLLLHYVRYCVLYPLAI